MKFICDRPSLLDAVNLVSGVVAPRSPRPQLTCVKLRAAIEGKVGTLSLSATDGEIFLSLTSSRVDISEPGEALIPADKLRQIVAAEDADNTLTITVEKDICEIRGADARFKIFGYPASDFPPAPAFPEDEKNVFSISAGDLRELVQRTVFAAARETSRYAINGVLLKRDGKKLEMVATDGRRLALARATASAAAAGTASCIVPTKALSLALKLMTDDEQRVHVALQGTQILIAFGDTDDPARAILTSNLVEGAFPPYEDVIPKDQDKKASFTRDALMSGVRRAALLTNEESRGVRLSIDTERLRLSSRAPEMGEAEIDVPVTEFTGDAIEIGFNPNFITDALKVMGDANIVIELKASNKPGLIRSGNDFLYVVMPVNLQ
ncbi:MAG: DNA polymerase III subunit beta [Phycisphaerales bacterium]|nr:MAG: DNA polymerase III subunit beta [Phycisphaerales bacterium]